MMEHPVTPPSCMTVREGRGDEGEGGERREGGEGWEEREGREGGEGWEK